MLITQHSSAELVASNVQSVRRLCQYIIIVVVIIIIIIIWLYSPIRALASPVGVS
jgi:hypothetical protein